MAFKRLSRGAATRLESLVVTPPAGLNTIDAGPAMPADDAVVLYNMIRAEFGLRSRLGYHEWCTGLSGAGGVDEVRTVLPFHGSTSASNKLFAVTRAGIYDCTVPTNAPPLVVAFGVTTGQAGYGTCAVVPTPAGRHLLYVDEANGYYVYTEATGTWVHVTAAASATWAPATAYVVGQYVANSGVTYVCTQNGNSAAAPATGPNGTGAGIVDGTCKWDYAPSISGLTPNNVVSLAVWKSRVWLVETNSSRAWYLGVNAIFGPAISFDFGFKSQKGGSLVGLWNWSYDGGSGMDTLLVGVTTGGDVVIYQGTNPADATQFGLKGVWYVGAVPAGRRCCTDFGGDLLVLGSLGLVPLSKLVIGNSVLDRSQYATAKIQNLVNNLLTALGPTWGWQVVVHPQDNCLLVVVPPQSGAYGQLAMSFATRGWSQYRDLPIIHAAAYQGQLYFGTPNGRICVNQDYVDNVTLSNPSQYTPVKFSLVTAFWNGGNSRRKQLRRVVPTFLTQGAPPVWTAEARYGYDLSEAANASGLPAVNGVALWDSALWDSGAWGSGSYVSAQSAQGEAGGSNSSVAVALSGYATARTSLVQLDVMLEVSRGLL